MPNRQPYFLDLTDGSLVLTEGEAQYLVTAVSGPDKRTVLPVVRSLPAPASNGCLKPSRGLQCTMHIAHDAQCSCGSNAPLIVVPITAALSSETVSIKQKLH